MNHRLKTLPYMFAAVILVLLPFHAFLTVWASSLVGHYTVLRLWKEILLAVLVIAVLVPTGLRWLRNRQNKLHALRGRPEIWLALGYLVVITAAALLSYLLHGATLKAAAYGWLLDGRYILFFLSVMVLVRHRPEVAGRWPRLLLVPAALVVFFGLLQLTVLPHDFLRHFGYGTGTIPAVATVDQKADYQRLQSTLRGPNPLGAYLVIILTACAALLLRGGSKVSPRRRVALTSLFVGATIVLLMTFSRSAWIGAIAAAGVLGWLVVGRMRRRLLLVCGSALVLVFAGTGYALRNNDTFQNTFFHTDEHSRSAVSSNQGHFTAMATGARQVLRQPLGSGVGTAGPASFYNAPRLPRIAENYYVQIAQEVGVVGVALYLGLTAVVARGLWLRRDNKLALVLLASLAGLTAVNLLLHAWADDTLAYVWWGLAGAALALPAAGYITPSGAPSGASTIDGADS
jgi:hypothetical protein